MNSSFAPVLGLKPMVPLLDLLLRIREDMMARPAGPYRYIGMPDVDRMMGFILGYQEVLGALDVEEGPDALFGSWLRDIKHAWPGEGWEVAYLRECEGEQTAALRKYLDAVAEFRTLSPETLASLPWRDAKDIQLATRAARWMPTRGPSHTLDFLLEIRRDGRLALFIGPIEVRRMEGLIAGYRLGLALVGARDEEYVRFERWLHERKEVPDGQEWPSSLLATYQGDPERAIRQLLEFAAEFRGAV